MHSRVAGWSSLIARWAHNPKVGGSNLLPATNDTYTERSSESDDLFASSASAEATADAPKRAVPLSGVRRRVAAPSMAAKFPFNSIRSVPPPWSGVRTIASTRRADNANRHRTGSNFGKEASVRYLAPRASVTVPVEGM